MENLLEDRKINRFVFQEIYFILYQHQHQHHNKCSLTNLVYFIFISSDAVVNLHTLSIFILQHYSVHLSCGIRIEDGLRG
jgi:hypothetical protein